MKRLRYIPLLLGLLILHSGDNLHAYTMEECIECHKLGSEKAKLHIPVKIFKTSIHHREETTCMDCHMDVVDEDHETTKGSGVVDCSECHDEENKHGQEATMEDRPQCHSCHPKHRMLEKGNPTSALHPQQLRNTCKECHPVESGETGYFSWLPSIRIMSHKKQDFSQAYGKDNCMGCHQGDVAHGEEDPIDEQTCYICHIGKDDQSPVMGYIHTRADAKKQPGILVAATIYQICIGLILLGVFRLFILRFSGQTRKRRK